MIGKMINSTTKLQRIKRQRYYHITDLVIKRAALILQEQKD